MQRFVLASAFALLSGSSCVLAGQSGSAPVKKTIEIQANAKVEVAAEVATVKIGYLNHAPTKDAVYAENTRVAQKIVQALLDGHVPASAIETQAIALSREEQNPGTPATKILQFSASQEWQVHVTASDAQKVVDMAIAAGANEVDGVDWDVKDPQTLEAQAYGAAIERAKKIAEQTASQSGVKLGEILSVSNSVNRFALGTTTETAQAIMVSASRPVATVPLTLYPPKIERQESVTVIYAIAP
jgi:uncharacterized protein